MAQLTDDCFAFGGPMLSVEDVERLIQERITPVAEIETIAVASAMGRVLAADVAAAIALPSFDNSAVDGYAVRHGDLASSGETRLPVAARLQAGARALAPIAPKTAIRIFTGAPMPEGADTVFMQEDCRTEGGDVILPAGLKAGANRRLTGEDVRQGATVIAAGQRLGPRHIAIAAAVGITELTVRRRLKLALFSTGDEIMEPGKPLAPAAVYDANRPLLASLARALGIAVTDLGILKDEETSLAAALAEAARDHDLVLTSGGVSTGEADFVRTALERSGKLTFWRTAIKPGRPVAMGVLRAPNGNTAAFAGLPEIPSPPSSPSRASSGRCSFVSPAPIPSRSSRFRFKRRSPTRRKQAGANTCASRSSRNLDGQLVASKYRQDGAGVISSLTETDGLVELPEDITAVTPGDHVGFLSYAALIG